MASKDFSFADSSMDLSTRMNETGQEDSVGEKFVELLRLCQVGEELLPRPDEITNFFQENDPDQEFSEWFLSLSADNVVTPDELKASEDNAHVPQEEVERKIEEFFGNQGNRVPVTKQMIDKLSEEERDMKNTLSVLKNDKKELQRQIDLAKTNGSLLREKLMQIRKEINIQLSSMTENMKACVAQTDKFVVQLRKHLSEDPHHVSTADFTEFHQLNETLYHAVCVLVEKLNQDLKDDSTIKYFIAAFSRLEKLETTEAQSAILKSSIERMAEEMIIRCKRTQTLVERWHNCFQHLVNLVVTEGKRESLLQVLLNVLTSVTNICKETKQPERPIVDRWQSFANKLPELHAIIMNDPDVASSVVSIEDFSSALTEFNNKLEELKASFPAHLNSINENIVQQLNKIYTCVKSMDDGASGSDNQTVETLLDCKEKVKETHNKVLDYQKADENQGNQVIEDNLLLLLTKPEEFMAKLEELENNVEILERGLSFEDL